MESNQIKVAIYGVCKNEENNILKWYEHAKDADYIFLLDTGSTDNTVKLARSLGIHVVEAVINPWSETTAKNTALSLLPKDIDFCICLDLDQVITTENWKEIINSSGSNFGVVTFNYKTANGYKDHYTITDQPLAHSRNNITWIKYRPRPFYVGNEDVDKVHLPIDVYHLPGNMDRFNNRESLYIDTYKREKLILEKYSELNYKYEIYGTLALSYFEVEDLENFNSLCDKILKSYDKDFVGIDFSENILMTNLYFARSLANPHKVKELMENAISKVYLSKYHDRFYVRLAIVSAISKKYDELGTYLDGISVEDYTRDIYNILLQILETKHISEEQMRELILYYGNIEYGKFHQELAKKSFKYFEGE